MVEGISTNTETALERGNFTISGQARDGTIVCTMQTYIVTNTSFACLYLIFFVVG